MTIRGDAQAHRAGRRGGLAAAVAAPAAAGYVNQGDRDKVLKVYGPAKCNDPVPGKKVEGGLGTVIQFSSYAPIAKVTIKSGKGAYVVYKYIGTYYGKVKLSKDVSNYVVWTCPKRY
jgi:hypothetical protein